MLSFGVLVLNIQIIENVGVGDPVPRVSDRKDACRDFLTGISLQG
jgi:hypothetical protein